MKKGMWAFEQLGKMLVALFVLFILIIIAFAFKNKMFEIADKLKDIF